MAKRERGDVFIAAHDTQVYISQHSWKFMIQHQFWYYMQGVLDNFTSFAHFYFYFNFSVCWMHGGERIHEITGLWYKNSCCKVSVRNTACKTPFSAICAPLKTCMRGCVFVSYAKLLNWKVHVRPLLNWEWQEVVSEQELYHSLIGKYM